ncbi:MAG: hypothetical protein LBC76_02265 [Treponema sp.]|jgi:putative ubiquitin-RnfH superfamily antitoxin RatB of RatAB toxin-antitoxin module|nr:hypothetical protein [Treponema sp.]
MNANLLKILRQIIASHGENILSDPQRLKAVFSDLAKNEPKEDRVAFGRCIEMGFYNEFKRTQTEDERQRLKITLANQLQVKTGIDKPHCNDALNLLEAAVFNTQQKLPINIPSLKFKLISVKTIIFGFAGALGGAIGELITEGFRLNDNSAITNFGIIINVAIWAAFIGLGISIGLLLAQNIYLKRTPKVSSLIKTAFIGIFIGAFGGGIAQFIFSLTYDISTLAEIISRIICWGIMGWGVGWGVSSFVPNFPKKRAMAAGFLGGFIGGAIFRVTFSMFPAAIGRVIGIMVLGFLIGLTISFIEEALRSAWLTIIWSRNETKTVTLGQKPIVFGSSREADIYLSKEAPIKASVQIENAKVVMYDKTTSQRRELKNGDRVDLGKVSFVVNTKK